MRRLLLLFLLAVGAGCGDKTLVVTIRLQPGADTAQQTSAATLGIVAKMESDATGFKPVDLITLTVNGQDRTSEMVMAGFNAVLFLDPAPVGVNSITLARRTGPPIDAVTWTVTAYAGPTVTAVTPNSAQENDTVTIDGTGFQAGNMRVFLGGAEAAIQSATATQITATVPAGAVPGPVMVYVGQDTAHGVVQFQPLDATAMPVPAPAGTLTLVACLPGRARINDVVEVWGYNFGVDDQGVLNDVGQFRLVGTETVNDPLVGNIQRGLIVFEFPAPTGQGQVRLNNLTTGANSASYPFTVD